MEDKEKKARTSLASREVQGIPLIRKQREEGERLQVTEYRNHDGSDLPVLQFPALEHTGLVRHFFTTRMGGVSTGIYRSMNVSFTRGDREESVRENYRRVADALGTREDRFVCTVQTHTTNVRIVTEADAGIGLTREFPYRGVDGLITEEPGIVLTAVFADCVPLLFVDPVHRAIGLSHSGWRGTVSGMGRVTVQKMADAFGSRPEDLICAIGPSICQNCYEVGRDVAEQFQKAFCGHEEEILTDRGNDKFLLDLWKANEIVLEEAGVLKHHISVTDVCTCCNPRSLFSHRATHGRRGNMGAFLMLRE